MHVSEAFSLAVKLAVKRGVRASRRETGRHHVTVGPWTLVFYGRDTEELSSTAYAVPPEYCVVVMRSGVPVGLVYPTGGYLLAGAPDASEEDALLQALESELSRGIQQSVHCQTAQTQD